MYFSTPIGHALARFVHQHNQLRYAFYHIKRWLLVVPSHILATGSLQVGNTTFSVENHKCKFRPLFLVLEKAKILTCAILRILLQNCAKGTFSLVLNSN